MATKRVTPGKKTAPKAAPKAAAATKPTAPAGLTSKDVMTILETAPSARTAAGAIDPEDRRRLVAAEAYFRAERRGFAAGHELEDWVAAEVAVDSKLQRTRVA